MNIKEYIASGILELYVAGVLSEKENQEIHQNLLNYPELQKEVEAIESAVIKLANAVSPKSTVSFDKIKNRLGNTTKVVELNTQEKKTNWLSYTGWAASILLGIGLFYSSSQNDALKEQIKVADTTNSVLEQQIADANEDATKAQELIAIFRDKEIISINLAGQTVAPETYAKVYWNRKGNTTYIDAAGLPEPPPGKVYQVWSLKLSPLTPTSIGLLSDFTNDDNKVFTLANPNESEAFGITLEPAGGSVSPTMEQLYTLGAV